MRTHVNRWRGRSCPPAGSFSFQTGWKRNSEYCEINIITYAPPSKHTFKDVKTGLLCAGLYFDWSGGRTTGQTLRTHVQNQPASEWSFESIGLFHTSSQSVLGEGLDIFLLKNASAHYQLTSQIERVVRFYILLFWFNWIRILYITDSEHSNN